MFSKSLLKGLQGIAIGGGPESQGAELKPDQLTPPVDELKPLANTELNNLLRRSTYLSIMEFYGVFLLKRHKMPVSDAMVEVEKVVSLIHERGEMDVSDIEHVKGYLKEQAPGVGRGGPLSSNKDNRCLITHILTTEMGELLQIGDDAKDDDLYDFIRVIHLQKDLEAYTKKLITKYKPAVKEICKVFIEQYGKLFKDDFLEKLED